MKTKYKIGDKVWIEGVIEDADYTLDTKSHYQYLVKIKDRIIGFDGKSLCKRLEEKQND